MVARTGLNANQMNHRIALCTLVLICVSPLAFAGDGSHYTRTRDVIYGRKFGTALTMDVFTPKKPNGAGLIFCVSGGWFSDHRAVNPAFFEEALKRGYTVFAVVHGSQPRYTIPEVVEDMHRAVRFIRHNGKKYGVDAGRLGIMGASAGGHLSLMIGTAGNVGDADARDAIDRESSRVAAVACFFPPTDFLNYGEKGAWARKSPVLSGFRPPFDYRRMDKTTRRLERVTDEETLRKMDRDVSPVYQVTKDDPPTLIIHGDADKLVPIQQAEEMIEALEKTGVTSKLIVKKGAGHGWPAIVEDVKLLIDWFDEHLAAG